MPEHQRVHKKSQKIQSIQDKRKICRKRAWRQDKKCGTSEKKLSGRKSASHCCRTKSTKTQWQMRNASQTGDSQLPPSVQQWVQTRSMPWPMLSSKGSRKVEQFRSICQEEMKEESEVEQEQGIASQQVALPTPGGVNRVAPASSLELDLPRVRGVPG